MVQRFALALGLALVPSLAYADLGPPRSNKSGCRCSVDDEGTGALAMMALVGLAAGVALRRRHRG